MCECQNSEETFEHLLMECELAEVERKEMLGVIRTHYHMSTKARNRVRAEQGHKMIHSRVRLFEKVWHFKEEWRCTLPLKVDTNYRTEKAVTSGKCYMEHAVCVLEWKRKKTNRHKKKKEDEKEEKDRKKKRANATLTGLWACAVSPESSRYWYPPSNKK